MCVCERESVCVCVYVCVRERECVWVCMCMDYMDVRVCF